MPIDCVSDHEVHIYDRGGKRRLHVLEKVDLVRWGRLRDDISEATVSLSGESCEAQSDTLNAIEPGRHEMVVWRGDERVWEGPLVRSKFTRSGVEFHAKDVVQYLYRTIMRAGYSSAYPHTESVIVRLDRIIRAELARKEALNPPVNVLAHLTMHNYSTDAKTAAVTQPYQMTVFEHLDDKAARGGMDYTAVGRAIHLWDTSRSLGQTQTVTENDFLGELAVSFYAQELATAATVTDGEGTWGTYPNPALPDPYYGEVEILATAYDESDGETPPTPGVMRSQAQRNLNGRNPTPMQVRIPDNSQLNPNGVLSISDLVPGVRIPLRATIGIKKISQMQKLDSMKVEETAAGETVSITLLPATASDVPPPEDT